MSELAQLLAHPDVERIAVRLRERTAAVASPPLPAKYAAVAIVMRAAPDGELEILMIKRAEYERDPWSGHVALPGGRHEPQDPDLEATAIRETFEETGIDITAAGRMLGVLDELHPVNTLLPPIVVRPYVGVVAPDVPIVPSSEVADAFWVRLADLRQPGRWIQTNVPIRGGVLRSVTAFQHGEYVVWGMTERLLRQVIALLD